MYKAVYKMFMKMHDERKEIVLFHYTNVQKKSQPLNGKFNAHLCSSEMFNFLFILLFKMILQYICVF